MKTYNKIVVGLLTLALLSVYVPMLYEYATAESSGIPFTLYSSVENDFVKIDFDDKDNITYQSVGGKIFTEHEFDSILPYFYYRQLSADGRQLPHNMSVQQINNTNFFFTSHPDNIKHRRPELYSLLEANPKRLDFEMPPDVFRITRNAIEFTDIKTNKINIEKSKMYTDAMYDAGFTFPAKLVAGNTNVRKEYDNGFLVLDDNSQLFNLKMIDDKPFVQKIDHNINIRNMFVTEFPSRRTLAFVCDKDNRFHILTSELEWIMTPFVFDELSQHMTLIGNAEDMTVVIDGEQQRDIYAVGLKYSNDKNSAIHGHQLPLIKKMSYEKRQNSVSHISPLNWL